MDGVDAPDARLSIDLRGLDGAIFPRPRGGCDCHPESIVGEAGTYLIMTDQPQNCQAQGLETSPHSAAISLEGYSLRY